MTKDKTTPLHSTELRRQAEDRIGEQNSPPPSGETEKDLLRFHHELHVHQVELEMQNAELRQTREKLETALDQCTDLYEFAPVGYFTLDRIGTISRVNLSGASLVGVERSRLIERRFGLLVTDEARPAYNAFLEKVFTSSEKVTCEVNLLKEGASPLYVQIEAVVAASGQECRIAIIDITERKFAMDALQKVEEAAVVALQKVEEATAAALLIVDEAADMPLKEKEVLELARLKVEKAVEAARLMVEENAEMPQNEEEKEAAGFARQRVEKAIEVSRLLLKTAAEVAQRRVEEKTAERKRANKALRESEEQFRLLIDGIKDYAIFMLDADGCVTSWNDGAKRLKGWDAKEILGRHFSLFFPEEAVAAGNPEHELEIAVAEGRFSEEGWRVRKDGSQFMADVVITAIRDESGKLRGFSKVTRDITEHLRAEALQQAKDVAEAATASKSQFLANMSHELRTPMTGVLGMLDLALIGNLEAEQREFIEIAQTSARSMVRILNDILDLTKIEKGKFSIVSKPFSIRKCVENACNIFFPVARNKGLDLNCTVADDVPQTLAGDQSRLNQVLTNLVGNAVKFTEKGSVDSAKGGSLLHADSQLDEKLPGRVNGAPVGSISNLGGNHEKTILLVILTAIIVPTSVFAECKIIDHGDRVEAICEGEPPTASEIAKRNIEIQAAETAQQLEQYINGKPRSWYEQCQSMLPEVKTADDYKRMSLGDVWADKMARKSAIARMEAMGCIPRGSRTPATPNFVTCTTAGGITNCSNGTTYSSAGGIIIGNNGTTCTSGSGILNCWKTK